MITQKNSETSLTTRLEMTPKDLVIDLLSEMWNVWSMKTRAIAFTYLVLAVLLFLRWLRNETKGTTLLFYLLKHFPDVCFVVCTEIIQTYVLKNDNFVHFVMGWMPCRQRDRQPCTTQEWTAKWTEWVDEYTLVFVLAILVLFYVVLGLCTFIHTHKPGKSKPDKNKPGKNKPDKNSPDKNKPGKSNPGKSNPGKSNPGKNNPGKNNPGKNKTRRIMSFVFVLLCFGFEMMVAKGVFANTDQEYIVWSKGVFANTDQEYIVWSKVVFCMLGVVMVIRRYQRQRRSNCVHRMMHIVKWCLRVVPYLFVVFIIAGSKTFNLLEEMRVYHSTRDPTYKRDTASGLKDSVVSLLPVVLLLVRLIQSPDAFGQIITIVEKETVVQWKRLRYLK